MRRQDVGQGHGRCLRLVDHPVIGLDLCPVALSHPAEGPIGYSGFGGCHVDQSPARTGIAQGSTAEFVVRPAIAFQTVRRRQDPATGIGRQADAGPEAVLQRMDEDGLERSTPSGCNDPVVLAREFYLPLDLPFAAR